MRTMGCPTTLAVDRSSHTFVPASSTPKGKGEWTRVIVKMEI